MKTMKTERQPYSLFSIQGAVELVSGTLRVLRSNESSIRDEVANLPRILSGPQGNLMRQRLLSLFKC